jgi:cell division protein FtsL
LFPAIDEQSNPIDIQRVEGPVRVIVAVLVGWSKLIFTVILPIVVTAVSLIWAVAVTQTKKASAKKE